MNNYEQKFKFIWELIFKDNLILHNLKKGVFYLKRREAEDCVIYFYRTQNKKNNFIE